MAEYNVGFIEDVLEKDTKGIPKNILKRIFHAIETRLTTHPAKYGIRLRKSLKGLWRIRVGDYRIAYTIKKNNVIIWGIIHRSDAYDVFTKRWSVE